MGRKKILIVEDEMLLAITIEEWLKSYGYEVVDIVATAKEAIQCAGKLRPDLIMMDIGLKGAMDGISAVEAIHETSLIPVLYLTACHDTETTLRANKTRHRGFMQKPVREDDLEITVAAVLNS